MSSAEIIALLDAVGPACKRLGIRRMRVGELEVEFGSVGEVSDAMLKKFHDFLDKGMPSDEEAMFWSAPGFVPESMRQGTAEESPQAPMTARQRKARG